MRLKKHMLGVVLICITALIGAGQAAAELKIGVMNVQKIVNLSEAGKVASGEIEVRMKELQGKFKTEEETLVALQTEIEKKSSAWNETKKSEKVREFQKLRREMQTKTEDARFELKQLQDKKMAPILKALEGVVNSYGKTNGFTAIFDANMKSGVIYFDTKIDVTEEIVKELNTTMTK